MPLFFVFLFFCFFSCNKEINTSDVETYPLITTNSILNIKDPLIINSVNLVYPGINPPKPVVAIDWELNVEEIDINDGENQNSFCNIKVDATNPNKPDEKVTEALKDILDVTGDLSYQIGKENQKYYFSSLTLSSIDGFDFGSLICFTFLEKFELSGSENFNSSSDFAVFEKLKNLKYITLSGIGLTEIPSFLNKYYKSLKSFNFSENEIADYNEDAIDFSSFEVLEDIDLSRNQLSDFEPLKEIKSLNNLNLKSNSLGLSSLDWEGFPQTLENLNLSDQKNNPTKVLLPSSLIDRTYPNLQNLDLSFNRISMAGFDLENFKQKKWIFLGLQNTDLTQQDQSDLNEKVQCEEGKDDCLQY